MDKKEILIKTAKEYFNSAEDEFKKQRYNSAVVLYFKALVSFLIYMYLKKQEILLLHIMTDLK